MNYKKIISCLLLVVLAACSPKTSTMVTKDKDGSKMLVGTFTRDALMNDPAFSWFKTGYNKYKPATVPVSVISKLSKSITIEVFGGTWCSDTHELLPAFYKVMDAAHISDAQITLHLVNREKKAKDGSTDKYKIVSVPTFVVMINGVQAGRVVESVKKSIEADIAEILTDKN